MPAAQVQPAIRVVLSADEDAPAAARRAVRSACEGIDGDCAEISELLVTELVTNAVRHAGGSQVELALSLRDGVLEVVVEDGGPGFVPRYNTPGGSRASGWGLILVDTFATRWGTTAEPPSVVWFQVDVRSRDAPAAAS